MNDDFFKVIKQGNKDEVERRLSLDPVLIHVRENGLSPILIAAYHNKPEIASFLADKTVGLTIFEAAATGKINNIIRLLARDPQLVSAYSEDGFQALGLASYFGHLDSAEYLVKAGAPVNSHSNNDTKAAPIHSASAGRHHKVVKMLLDNRADPNIREQGGYTSLHITAQSGNVEMIRVLLFGGADVNLKSDDDKSPLDIAIETGHDKATLLLEEGITKRFRIKRIE